MPVFEIELAQHLSRARAEDIPDRAMREAKRAIIWWTATAIEGSSGTNRSPLRDYAAAQSTPPEATALGTGLRLTAEAAGLLNGAAGKVFEHEDKYWVNESIGFAPACAVVPAAVAIAQAIGGASGIQLMTAVSLAIDLEVRLIRPLGLGFAPGHAAANATFVLGTYGAAAAAAKILGLDRISTGNALAIAHTQAAGNFQAQMEGRGVAAQCGFAVRNGIAAARLSSSGAEGPNSWLTGRAGLYATHFPATPVKLASILEGLGQEFPGTSLGYKAYPCGIVAHPAIDAAIELRAEAAVSSISKIRVLGPAELAIMADPINEKRRPSSSVEAAFSLPWMVACALRYGNVRLEHLGPEALNDTFLRRLAAGVDIHMSSGTRDTSVEIELDDGEILRSHYVIFAKGHPKRPLATPEMLSTLRQAARQAGINERLSESAAAQLEALEECADIDPLFSSLLGPSTTR